jgi:hypothetical protein
MPEGLLGWTENRFKRLREKTTPVRQRNFRSGSHPEELSLSKSSPLTRRERT